MNLSFTGVSIGVACPTWEPLLQKACQAMGTQYFSFERIERPYWDNLSRLYIHKMSQLWTHLRFWANLGGAWDYLSQDYQCSVLLFAIKSAYPLLSEVSKEKVRAKSKNSSRSRCRYSIKPPRFHSRWCCDTKHTYWSPSCESPGAWERRAHSHTYWRKSSLREARIFKELSRCQYFRGWKYARCSWLWPCWLPTLLFIRSSAAF